MSGFRVRAAEPRDIPALMRLKRLLAEGEDSAHAVRATAADWLRDGFGPQAGFTAFVAEREQSGDVGGRIIGMATCSRRKLTGWNGPVIFLQDLFVEPALPRARRRPRADGAGRGVRPRTRQPDRRAHGAGRQSGATLLSARRVSAAAGVPDLCAGGAGAGRARRARRHRARRLPASRAIRDVIIEPRLPDHQGKNGDHADQKRTGEARTKSGTGGDRRRTTARRRARRRASGRGCASRCKAPPTQHATMTT